MARPFRFGVQLATLPPQGWAERLRHIESLGYSTAFWPDHFGDQLEPVAALAAAAAVTERLNVGTLVFGVDYRHPVVLAKAAATVHLLSGGRCEFGLGAGWANVPVLNLLMGAPLKISVATSKFLLSITDTSAAWVYLNQGCVIAMMVVPSVVGIMLGSFIGVRILRVAKPAFVRWIVIALLLFAGAKALTKGLNLPFIV